MSEVGLFKWMHVEVSFRLWITTSFVSSRTNLVKPNMAVFFVHMGSWVVLSWPSKGNPSNTQAVLTVSAIKSYYIVIC